MGGEQGKARAVTGTCGLVVMVTKRFHFLHRLEEDKLGVVPLTPSFGR